MRITGRAPILAVLFIGACSRETLNRTAPAVSTPATSATQTSVPVEPSHGGTARFNRDAFLDWVSNRSKEGLGGAWLVIRAADPQRMSLRENSETASEDSVPILFYEFEKDGSRRSWYLTSWNFHRGGDSHVDPEMTAKLRAILAALPADSGILPPVGRRVLIRADAGTEHAVTRVYDLRSLPDAALELFRAGGCRIGSMVHQFEPVADIDARRFENSGIFKVAPDGRTMLFSSRNYRFQRWEAVTHEPLGDIDSESWWSDVAFSSDGWQVIAIGRSSVDVVDPELWKTIKSIGYTDDPGQWMQFSDPRFTSDGRYALVRRTRPRPPDPAHLTGLEPRLPELLVYETDGWTRIAAPPFLPPACVGYREAADGRIAVAELAEKKIVLWVPRLRKVVAVLDPSAWMSDAVFSPDESLVALSSAETIGFDGHRGGSPHLRIFDTTTGRPAGEMFIADLGPPEVVRDLAWVSENRLLLAAVRPGPGRDEPLCVWDVRTGREQCKFAGSVGAVLGICILKERNQVVAGAEDGHVRFWDLRSAEPADAGPRGERLPSR